MASQGTGSKPQEESKLVDPEALKKWLEAVFTLGSLAAFCGYMNLRAQWNYLGIPVPESIGAQRYLSAAYPMLIDMMVGPVFVLGITISLIAVTVSGVLAKAVLARRPKEDPPTSADQKTAAEFNSAWANPIAATLVLMLLSFVLLKVWAWWKVIKLDERSAILVGVLNRDSLIRPEGEIPLFWTVLASYWGAVALTCGYRSVRLLPGKKNIRATQKIYWAATFIWVALVVNAPVIYGIGIRPTLFNKVNVQWGTKTIQGVLMLESSDFLTVWNSKNGRGEMVALPRRSISSVTYLEKVDVLKLARESCRKRSVVSEPPSTPSARHKLKTRMPSKSGV